MTLHVVQAEGQQHRLLQPLIDDPGAVALLGHPHLAGIEQVERRLHRIADLAARWTTPIVWRSSNALSTIVLKLGDVGHIGAPVKVRADLVAGRAGQSTESAGAAVDRVRPRSADRRRQPSAVAELELSSARLMRDANYPWLLLVPRVAYATEIVDLDGGATARSSWRRSCRRARRCGDRRLRQAQRRGARQRGGAAACARDRPPAATTPPGRSRSGAPPRRRPIRAGEAEALAAQLAARLK